jgi:hypothetical protein
MSYEFFFYSNETVFVHQIICYYFVNIRYIVDIFLDIETVPVIEFVIIRYLGEYKILIKRLIDFKNIFLLFIYSFIYFLNICQNFSFDFKTHDFCYCFWFCY